MNKICFYLGSGNKLRIICLSHHFNKPFTQKVYKHSKISKSGVGLCMCAWEREREKKKQTDLPNLQFVCLKKCFPSKVILRMECLPVCVFLNTHGEKWRLKKVIHTWQLYLLIFHSHKFPVTAKAFIPSIVQTQLIPYIMGESNRQDTPSAGTTECLLRTPSTPAIKAQDKQMC